MAVITDTRDVSRGNPASNTPMFPKKIITAENK